MKSLNFILPSKFLDYEDYLVTLELFCRNIPNGDLDCVKTRTKEIALRSYCNYNNNELQNLSKADFLALKNLYTNNNIAFQTSVINNSVVVVDKAYYSDKIQNFLNEVHRFQKINLKNDGFLDFVNICLPFSNF